MKYNKTLKDILKVSASNIIVLFSGVLVGFLLPKIVGIVDYGYYKTYTLYATYVGMFHFGIIDGIYLKYGGENYEDLNRNEFCFYSRFFFFLESAISIIMIVVSLFFISEEYKFIFTSLALYLFFHNVTSYYQIISQATSRFSELSHRNIIQSSLISLVIVVLWIVKDFYDVVITYKIYIMLYTLIVVILAVWYMVTYKAITFGSKNEKNYKNILIFIITGFPLMVANLCSSLLLTLDRQFVNILFDNITYASYAFAYNMLSLITTATTAIAMVIYPKLKRSNEEELGSQYPLLMSAISSLLFLGLTIYFPLNEFVNWFLPQFKSSLLIFRIIFPGLVFSSAITIVMHNYYKTLGISFKFFTMSLIALFISILSNYIAYIIFHTTSSISIASVITMLIWYVLVERSIIELYMVKWKKRLLYLLSMTMVFYIVTFIGNSIIGAITYILLYIVITFIFNKNYLFTTKIKRRVL